METLITAATDGQKKQIRRFAEDAIDRAIADNLLDKDSIQRLIENGDKFQADVIASIEKYSRSSKFIDEEIGSGYGYYSRYRKPKNITEQISILHQLFPGVGFADEKLAEREVPKHAEGWFAIPKWQTIAPTYNQAVEIVLDLIRQQRAGCRDYCDQIGEQYLRQHERTAEKLKVLSAAQKGYDILVVPAQFGLRHRDRSVRRAREVFMGNEFGLGAFEIGCMILTHPERLYNSDNLYVDCAGSEYARDGDGNFSSAPHFCFDRNEVEFDANWVNEADERFGSASAFLPQ